MKIATNIASFTSKKAATAPEMIKLEELPQCIDDLESGKWLRSLTMWLMSQVALVLSGGVAAVLD
jgi:hypothetical protein